MKKQDSSNLNTLSIKSKLEKNQDLDQKFIIR